MYEIVSKCKASPFSVKPGPRHSGQSGVRLFYVGSYDVTTALPVILALLLLVDEDDGRAFDEEEFYLILKKTNNKSAPGWDGITYY